MLWYLLGVTLDLLARKHILLPERAFVLIVDQQLYCRYSVNVVLYIFLSVLCLLFFQG